MRRYLSSLVYLLGPMAFAVTLLLPSGLPSQAQSFLAIFLLVIGLWVFTDVPLFISGILGVTLTILLGIETPVIAFAPFADPIIFLFLAGFLLAKALESTELDKIIAYKALSHSWVQGSPKKTVLVFLGLSFFLSMWISNTAAVAMLIPFSFGIIKKFEESFNIKDDTFSEQLLLGLAYSATVGGNVTPIGSPPNIIAIGHLKNLVGVEIGFLHWMVMALPLSLVVFFFIYRKVARSIPSHEVKKPLTEFNGDRSFNKEQKYVIGIFCLTVLFWIFPSLLSLFISKKSSIGIYFQENLSAPVVGVFFVGLLFLAPFGKAEKILSNKHTFQVDWPSLLLFGSGLSLGRTMFKTGLASNFSDWILLISNSLGGMTVIIIIVIFTIIFTELASNTASSNILIPIMIALAQSTSLNPTVIAFVFALACNSAFMLPVATPPNVIVFGTEKVRKVSMLKAGASLNLLCALLLCIGIILFSQT